MRMPRQEDRLPPHYYEAARVELHCPATTTHARTLILEQATIHPDGWARWVEDGHVYIGYVQTGRCCDPPSVSAI
jgi:hypothetical protein